MYTSPHQLQESSSTFLAWQRYTTDDFEDFLTCRAREFKKNGILALVFSSRPNCLEGIVFLKLEIHLPLRSTQKKVYGTV